MGSASSWAPLVSIHQGCCIQKPKVISSILRDIESLIQPYRIKFTWLFIRKTTVLWKILLREDLFGDHCLQRGSTLLYRVRCEWTQVLKLLQKKGRSSPLPSWMLGQKDRHYLSEKQLAGNRNKELLEQVARDNWEVHITAVFRDSAGRTKHDIGLPAVRYRDAVPFSS